MHNLPRFHSHPIETTITVLVVVVVAVVVGLQAVMVFYILVVVGKNWLAIIVVGLVVVLVDTKCICFGR